jgi:ribosomal protein S18 acetylase RimI-like enzyme
MMIRDMHDDEAGEVAEMVHGLARDIGVALVPKLTASSLLDNRSLIEVLVAEEQGLLLGVCLTLLTFSTWRGAKGLYVVDLFVDSAARNRNVGLRLLREAARRGHAKGARFIKLEIDRTNLGAERFYQRLGFRKKAEDRLLFLEQDELDTFLNRRDGT